MDLKSYIRGERGGPEIHDLERQAMEDRLLDEALEGFDAVTGDHTATVERLRVRVAARVRDDSCAVIHHANDGDIRATAAGMHDGLDGSARIRPTEGYAPRYAAEPSHGVGARRFSMIHVRAVVASLLICLCLGVYLAWMSREPRPSMGTLPVYPELNPWEGSCELIEQNRSRRAAGTDNGLPVGIGPA